MRSARQNGQIVRFGAYEADLRNLELRKLGMRIRLQNQPFRILERLLRRQGSIVSREELRSALWDEDPFVEFDHAINTAMQKIRGVLNDSATNPRFIETVPRRGYRFIAPVQFVTGPPSPQTPTRAVRGKSLTMARLAGLVERGLSYITRSQP
jgi:DNA-binding winged helix-turn-helix (wHTH) protein